MKKLLNILLVLVLALSLALPALAEEAEAPAPQIVDAKVITYTTDEARTVAAVRIEYAQPITTRGALLLDARHGQHRRARLDLRPGQRRALHR